MTTTGSENKGGIESAATFPYFALMPERSVDE